ncbi:recombinase family protein [Actinoplanes sp. NPDC049596]|uniref:recombinase family protein n=1 Tax=unclassified Actinoplanes TaxID=2626549 RepID=UPI00341D6B9D
MLREVIGLARVSTDAQELARQIDALKAAGWARIYLDKAFRKKGTNRPGPTAALDHMRRGDTLAVFDLTRLGRDTRELLAIVEDDLHAYGRHLRTLDGIVLDTSDELIFTGVRRRREVSASADRQGHPRRPRRRPRPRPSWRPAVRRPRVASQVRDIADRSA